MYSCVHCMYIVCTVVYEFTLLVQIPFPGVNSQLWRPPPPSIQKGQALSKVKLYQRSSFIKNQALPKVNLRLKVICQGHLSRSLIKVICQGHLLRSFVKFIFKGHLSRSLIKVICPGHLSRSFVKVIC